MGTISVTVIICCLIISAALTVIIILVTVPTETDNADELEHLEHQLLGISQNAPPTSPLNNYLHFHSKENLNSSSQSSSTTRALTSAAVTVAATLPGARSTPAVSSIVEDDKRSLQSAEPSTAAIVTWKPQNSQSSGRSTTTVHLSTNITVAASKAMTSGSRHSTSRSRHHLSSKQSNFTAKLVTARKSRKNLATLTLHQHIEQLPLKDDVTKSRQQKQQVTHMELLREVTFPNGVKLVGLAVEGGFLYAATNDGQITVMNAETGEQIEITSVNGKIDRMTVTHNGDVVILNGTILASYREGQKYKEMKLPIGGKSLSAYEDEADLQRLIALGRSNDVLFVFTDDLRPVEEVYYRNDLRETCNFALFHRKYYYISCQTAILQLSEDGEIKRKIGYDNGTFSLGITVDDQARIIAVVRGQPLVRVFQDGKLQHNLSAASTEVSAIWSEVLYDNGRLHVIDYLTSTLKTFRYPFASIGNNP
uniref:Strictosidine synthase conserved region domain-containing protein n=1 Tax=Setaria digitata TaxID=48799 RepID=A0A915PY18_9BILA